MGYGGTEEEGDKGRQGNGLKEGRPGTGESEVKNKGQTTTANIW